MPVSVLQILSQRCVSQYLHTSRTSSCSLSKWQFCVGRQLPILKPQMLGQSGRLVSSASPFSPTDTSNASQIGGGCSRLAWMTVEPYVVSKPSMSNKQSSLHYVAYVDEMGLKAYPSDRFVHAAIPLPIVSQLLSITVARSIAMTHGIVAGSRCTVAQLRSCVGQHKCLCCLPYTTVFSVEDDSVKKNAMRVSVRYVPRSAELDAAARDGIGMRDGTGVRKVTKREERTYCQGITLDPQESQS